MIYIILLQSIFLHMIAAEIVFKPPYGKKSISCEENGMVISLVFCNERGCKPNYLLRYLPNPSGQQNLFFRDLKCHASEWIHERLKSTLIFRTPYDGCGTERVISDDGSKIIYRQSIQTVPARGPIIRTKPVQINFECSFQFVPTAEDEPPTPTTLLGTPEELVNCGGKTMSLSIPKAQLPRYKAKDLHLRDPNCKLKEVNGNLVAETGYNKCGSQITIKDGKITIVNQVLSDMENNVVTRKKRVSILFGCEYLRGIRKTASASIKSELEPPIDQKLTSIVEPDSTHDFRIDLVLLNSNMSPVKDFAKMSVGERAHVALSVSQDVINLGLIPVAEECYVTPKNARGEDINKFRFDLVVNKCPVEETTKIRTIPQGQIISFEVFAFVHNLNEQLVIHCDAVMCDKDDKSCQTCSKRRTRRSVHTYYNTEQKSNKKYTVTAPSTIVPITE